MDKRSGEMTKEQLGKLPKFAQEYIHSLELNRDLAIRQLNEFVDSQTESSIWIDEYVCTGEQRGPSPKRHYLQTHRVTFKIGNSEVYVSISLDDASQLNVNCGGSGMVFKPVASNAITIVDK